LKSDFSCFEKFEEISTRMNEDCKPLRGLKQTSKIYNQDSRIPNKDIPNGSANLCITSPPYLNNLDYGEVSKVHSHFFDITSDWGDITRKVRKKLVTGSTTHYKEAEFSIDELSQSEFAVKNWFLTE
jgi:DNA modification methylase